MKKNKFLIAIVYYERPKMILNALESISKIKYNNFEVHLIDDGSKNKAEPIVREFFPKLVKKFKFSYIDDTVEKKKYQGGSLHGQYLNQAIEQSDADHVIVLCDDDAIYPNFLESLNKFLNEEQNKNKLYFYHNIILYDGLVEKYTEGVKRKDLSYYTNQWKTPIDCNCRVDGSQVTYDRKSFVESGIRYPYPQTSMLDAASFRQMYSKWGPAYYSGLIGQVKSMNADNLIYKYDRENQYITKDEIDETH